MHSDTLLLLVYLFLFLLMILIPLLPVIRAVREKSDFDPLPVNMTYSKDPRAIAKYFGQYFVDAFTENTFKIGDRLEDEKLGKLEVLGDTFSKIKYQDMVYIIGEVEIPRALKFEREVIARDALVVGDHCSVRAIKAEKKLTLGKECCIVRWIDAEGSISVGQNTHVNIASSASLIHLSRGVEFNRLFGHPVLTSHSFSFQKNRQHMIDEHLDDAAIDENLLYIQDEKYVIEKKDKLFRSIVTQGDLLLEEEVKVFGSIKINGDVVLQDNCFIDGNIIAEGNITIGEHCFITGNLFSRRGITIGSYTQIGTSENTKSVVAQKEISLCEHVAIFNYILTDSGGKVV
ncbi:MAG TPA: hypothetical protein EYG82_02000 [Sulfurovum sp.]|nr:hypothetical protein [Sulfurovum sp.]